MFLKLFINIAVLLPNIGLNQVFFRNWDSYEYQINRYVPWEVEKYQPTVFEGFFREPYWALATEQ